MSLTDDELRRACEAADVEVSTLPRPGYPAYNVWALVDSHVGWLPASHPLVLAYVASRLVAMVRTQKRQRQYMLHLMGQGRDADGMWMLTADDEQRARAALAALKWER